MSSEVFQGYVRRVLFWLSGALASYGVFKPDASWIEPAIAFVTTLATFGWSLYGDRLNGLLERVQAKSGVITTNIEVDPTKIHVNSLNTGTSSGISATAR